MTIAKKLSLGFGIVVTFTPLLGLIALLRLATVTDALNQVVTDSLPGMYSTAKIVSVAKEQKSLMVSHIASESTVQMDQFEAMLTSQNTKLMEELKNYQKTIF